MPNLIKRILIENIKGKEKFEIEFNNLTANFVNIIVAPNGYGKTTLASAFKAAVSGKLKNFVQLDKNKISKLEIELLLENNQKQTVFSTNQEGHISELIHIGVINSGLYAKNTGKHFGNVFTKSAELLIKDIEICKKPIKSTFKYNYNIITKHFSKNGLFRNLSSKFDDLDFIEKLLLVKKEIMYCLDKKINIKLDEIILESIKNQQSTSQIKGMIQNKFLYTFKSNKYINKIIDTLKDCIFKEPQYLDSDSILDCAQVFLTINEYSINELKNYYEYKKYKYIKDNLDQKLNFIFNSTNRRLQTKENNNKLFVKFFKAEEMSNGERDLISFFSELVKYDISYNKNIGILIIDEVFDYLDGANMLIAQYYLSSMIEKSKKKGKLLFPIILTHLDPLYFNNYYLKRQKCHYISISSSNLPTNSPLINLLLLRTEEQYQKEIDYYLLHYNNESHVIPEILNKQFEGFNYTDNKSFYNDLYNEINTKYLNNKNYDPFKVAIGIRIKIEEKVYFMLKESNQQIAFIDIHKTTKKLDFAQDNGTEIPELYYLLKPLYNDSLHLSKSNDDIAPKTKAMILKLDNIMIKNLIKHIFI